MTAIPAEIARRALADHLAALPAAELLSRYATRRDPEAFAGLVQQFGPMVLGVCRRVLGSSADVDDAFQTVFLALARQADSFRAPATLPAWLHRVSLRVAHKTLARRAPAGEPPEVIPDPADPLADVAWREVRRVLDEELDRLPDKLRGPVVLCWLDGLTQDEAAGRLGVSLATLKRHLEAGRELLRSRLARRGLAPVLAATAVSAPSGLRAVVADELVTATLALVLSGAPLPPGVDALIAPAIGLGAHALRALAAVGLIAGTVAAGMYLTAESASPRAGSTATPPTPSPTATPSEPEAAPKKGEEPQPPQPPPPPPPRLDALGDPLPAGAQFRIGTDRFRVAPVDKGPHVSALSPDRKKLAVKTGTGALSLIDLNTGQPLWENGEHPAVRTTWGNEYPLGQFVFAPDGRRLYALSPVDPPNHDSAQYAVQVFDAETGRSLERFVRPDNAPRGEGKLRPGYSRLWFPAGSKHLFVQADREVRALDPMTGREVHRTPAHERIEAVSADGQVYARVPDLQEKDADQKGRALVQLAPDGKEVRRYPLNPRTIYDLPDVFLSPDGTRLVQCSAPTLVDWGGPARGDGGGDSGFLVVWDTTTGTEVLRKSKFRSLQGPGFAPDGRTFIGTDVEYGNKGYSDKLVAVDLATGAVSEFDGGNLDDRPVGADIDFRYTDDLEVGAVRDHPFVRGRFHPFADGKSGVSIGQMGTITRWEFGDGKLKQLPDLGGGTNRLIALRSASGRIIAAAHKDTGRVDLADGATGKPLRTIRTGSLIQQHAISPDGSVLATLDPIGGFILWDTASGAQKHLIARSERPKGAFFGKDFAGGVAFSSDGAVVVVSTVALGNAAYEVQTARQLWTHPVTVGRFEYMPEWPVYAPDGQVVFCHDDAFRDAKTGERLNRFEAGMIQKGGERSLLDGVAVFSNGGGRIAGLGWAKEGGARTTRRVVRVLHSGGVSEFRLLPLETKINGSALAFGPNGVWAATADGPDIVIWDVGTETAVRRLKGHRANVTHIEWGHDARTLLSSADDRTSLLWDVRPELPPHAPSVEQLRSDLAGDGPTAFRAVWELERWSDWYTFGRDWKYLPRSAPDEITGDYWRWKRLVIAFELHGWDYPRNRLKEWAGEEPGELLTEDAKAALARIKLREGKK